MTKKETVTAREDQPQLGTCDFNPTHREQPHPQEVWCRDWKMATEDQPRPTPAKRHNKWPTIRNKSEAGEAQGEAPQPQDKWAGWRLADTSSTEYKTLFFGSHCVAANIHVEYADKLIAALLARVETGAHPSQDAHFNALLLHTERIEREVGALRFTVESFRDRAGARSTPSLQAQDAQQEHASLQQSYIHVFERAEAAEAELAQIKEHCIGEHDCTFCGGSTPSPDPQEEK